MAEQTIAAYRPLGVSKGLSLASAACLGVVALATFVRLAIGWDWPLWLDESWTGMIARQPTISDFVRQAHGDVNAPLYYVVAWLAAKVLGYSDWGLRMPSLIFASVAPAMVLLDKGAIGRNARLTWLCLIACWGPALDYAHEARAYALMIMLGVGSTASLCELLREASMRNAMVWAALTATAALTHYFAAPLALCQGAAILSVHRRRALRLWPAAMFFVPFPIELAWHWARLADFSRPDVIWYSRLNSDDIVGGLITLFGGWPLLLWSPIVLLALLPMRRSRPSVESARPAELAALASIAAIGLVMIASAVKPMFAIRYLLVDAPGAMLWLALRANDPKRLISFAPALLVFPFVVGIGLMLVRPAEAAEPRWKIYGYERGSQWLEKAGVRDVSFLWDHPAASIQYPDALEQVDAFIFDRDRYPVRLQAIVVRRGQNPNVVLEQLTPPGGGLIWLYDTKRPSAARSFPPSFDRRGWTCRQFGDDNIGSVACRRLTASPARSP